METKIGKRRSARMVIKESLKVELRKFYVLCANIEAHGHVGSCPRYALLILHGNATKRRKDEFRERIGRIIERTWAGEAWMKTDKDRIAERKRVREKRRARIERGTGDVPEKNPGIRMMSRWRFDMRTHLAGTS